MRTASIGRRFVVAVLPISLLLSGLTLAVSPFGPVIVAPAGPAEAREIETSVDRLRTLELPFVASHVALHWPGAADARVTVAFAPVGGAYGPDLPVTLDEGSEASDTGETYGGVLWTGGARFARISTDRPLPRLTVVAMAEPSGTLETLGGSVVDAAVGQHAVITRAGWGANESLRFDAAGREIYPPQFYPLQQIIIHHTAGRNGDPDPAATIRAIYYDHAVIRRYGDIDYNYLIDEAGRIYESRHAREWGPNEIPTSEDVAGNLVRAIHAGGVNPGSLGIALLGNLTSQDPTPAARAALTWLLAWIAERHGIDPTVIHQYVNPESGLTLTLPVIAGHRDVNVTACPGDTFYATLPALRTAVAARIAATTGPAVDHAAPSVMTFASRGPSATGATSIQLGLTFSEPVTDLTASDFAFTGTSSGWAVTGVSGSAATYTVTVAATAPTPGSMALTLPADRVLDLGANPGPANPATATVAWAPDGDAPSGVLFSTPGSSPTTVARFDVTVKFDESIVPFTSNAVKLGGTSQTATPWKVGFVLGSGAGYEFVVWNDAPADGTLTFGLPAGATADLAGNAGLASNTISFTVDRTAPTTTAPLLSPSIAAPGATVTVSAAATDALAVASAQVNLAGGAWTTMSAGDGAFGGAGEALNASLTAPATTGSYSVCVRATDSVGNLSGGTACATLTVSGSTKTATAIVYTGTTVAAPGATITLSATLKTGAGTPLANKVVTFTLNGTTLSATTTTAGLAALKTTAPTVSASYPIGVAFAGDTTYAAATKSATLLVKIATKLTYSGPIAAAKGARITLSATLKAAAGTAIAGKAVTFKLNGKTFSATTDSSGLARLTATAASTAASYTITVAFAGDATYVKATATGTLKVS